MKENRSVHESLVLIMQFGINMIVPIFMCTCLGVWLSHKTGHEFFAVLLFIAGAVAGIQNCYRITKRMIAREQAKKGSREIAAELAAEAKKGSGEKTDAKKN